VVQSVDSTKPLYNVRVRDACQATTAVPIFFPAACFNEQVSGEQNQSGTPEVFNVIDGGIAVNDPVGFSSSHFLQFLLPMNIRHSSPLIYKCIDFKNLRYSAWPWALCINRFFSGALMDVDPILIRISVQRCNLLIWFLYTIIIIFCNKNMVELIGILG
jgi:hypothetical protein